jgi:hypothetical protein
MSPEAKATDHDNKRSELKMKHYLNSNKVAKSFVLAGALSFGIFAGGQFTEAAGPDQAKAEKTVQVKPSNNAKVNVEVKPVVPAAPAAPAVQAKDEVKPNEEKASKSQASVHASENAELNAAPNSAVLGKGEKAEEVVVEEQVKEEVPVEETTPVIEIEPVVVTDETDADTTADTESEEAVDVDNDVAAKTEDEDDAEKEEVADTDSDSVVRIEDEEDEDKDSENIEFEKDAIVKTEDDEEAEVVEEEEKVNPSAANKAKSQASVKASDTAKAHAADNSAVLCSSSRSTC